MGLIFGLLGLLAGRLGHLYPLFDVFAQFGAQFSMIVVAFSVAIFVPSYKGLTGAALAAVFAAIYGAWPHYVSRGNAAETAPLEPGEKLIRVAHFNTFADNLDNAAVAQEVIRLNADVVTLVEFEKPRVPVIALLTPTYPYHYACHDVPHCNIAVFSRYPIEGTSTKTNWRQPPFLRAKLGGELTGLSVYAVHSTRFPHSRWQLIQAEALVRETEAESDELLVMGDFNATPFSRITSVIERGAGLQRLTNLPTWPAFFGFPQLAIDHIFVSGGLRAISPQQIGNSAGSDHFPITMTLAFKAR